MKQTINKYNFIDAFKNSDTYRDSFSYSGLTVLYEHLIEIEDAIGEELDLDIVMFADEYTEYDSLSEFNEDYGKNYTSILEIENNTSVIPVDSSGHKFIIKTFLIRS